MCMKWAYRCKPGIPGLGRWRQEDQEFKVIVYRQKEGSIRDILFSLAFTLDFLRQ